MSAKSKIIVALDVNDLGKAKKLVKLLYPKIKFFKIGLEFINTGKAPELISFIKNLGGKVFYDIKLNDIPNTVGRSVKVISKLGVWGFTIHASSGREAIQAARANKGKAKLIGVTVLTSIDTQKNKIVGLAQMLAEEKADGVVCSVNEAVLLKRNFPKLKVITPGIRPSWAETNDQKRLAIPRDAIKAGSDYLVIGRPITGSSEPLKALELIRGEIKR